MDHATKRTFNFVNLNHPDDLKDEETQLRIRRLAMTEVGKARRKPKTRRERNEIVLELRSPHEKPVDTGIERLGAGLTDPFSTYPVDVDDSGRILLANIFDTDSLHSTQLRGSWYPVGLESAAAFHNVLANSQNFLFQKANGYFPSQDDTLALVYHHKALRYASEMMKDVSKHQSDEMLGAVASFMCHQALLGNFAGTDWHKHRSALISMIRGRGGYNALRKEHLRITLTWSDLLGSFTQDIPPLVPMPQKWETHSRSPPNSPRPISTMSLLWKQLLPMQIDWISVFDDTAQLISLDQAFNEKQLVLAITSGSWMEPTIYRLLEIRPLHHSTDREHLIEEVCRLGTLLFLAPLWRIMGQSPVRTTAITRNLLLLLTKNMIEWNELKPLLLWVVYMAAIETQDLGERSQLVFMLAVLMSGMQLLEWQDIMKLIKSVLWVDKVYGGTDDLIRDEVLQIVIQNPMRAVVVATPPTFLDDFQSEVEQH
ncbi:hypothetical protein ACN47E_008148 [Coniothyrium glycines]